MNQLIPLFILIICVIHYFPFLIIYLHFLIHFFVNLNFHLICYLPKYHFNLLIFNRLLMLLLNHLIIILLISLNHYQNTLYNLIDIIFFSNLNIPLFIKIKKNLK